MNLTKYSKSKLYASFVEYEVDKGFAEPIYNYLVHGYEPGGFFHNMLANDFMNAMSRSHPGNTVTAIKHLVSWIVNEIPRDICWGSYHAVDEWLKLTDAERRVVLEQRRLIFSEKDEIIMVLKDLPVRDPEHMFF
jgi:hypothetical protein